MTKEIEKPKEIEAPKKMTSYTIVPEQDLTTLTKDDTVIEVRPGNDQADVTVNDTGRGVHVEAHAAPDGEQKVPQGPDVHYEDKAMQVLSTYDATFTAPATGPVTVVNAAVTLVNKEAEDKAAKKAAAEAAAKAAAPEAEADAKAEAKVETGVEVSFSKYDADVTINGTEAKIGIYDNDATVFANRIQVKPFTVPAEAAAEEAAPAEEAVAAVSADAAAEAAPAGAGKITINLRKDFNRAVVEGLNGAKCIIELGKKDENDIVITTGGMTVRSAAEAGEVGGPGIKVNGDVTRLVLVDDKVKVFDFNNVTGRVIAYGDVDTGDKAKLAEEEPEDRSNHKIVISADGTSLALNKAVVEKTAEGVIAVTTDGVGQIKPVNQSPSAIAEEEAKIGQWAKEGWKHLATLPDGKILLIADEDIGVMDRKKAQRLIEKLARQDSSIELPDVDTLVFAFQHATKIGGFKQGEKGHYSSAAHYHAKDGKIVDCPSGVDGKGGTYDDYSVRLVCTM